MSGAATVAGPASNIAVVSDSAPQRRLGLRLLTWAFTFFNAVRMVAYVPTMWAICTTGNSSQHSLWTWCIWLGANATMAAWLHENNGRRVNKAVLVNAGNAVMCLATVLMILQHRF
jgi:hypothetical protein